MNKQIKHIIGFLSVGTAGLLSSCGQLFSEKLPHETTPSYVLMETNSERVLRAQNANERRPVGMLANIATAVVAIDWQTQKNISLDTMLVVPSLACQWPETNLLHLRPGDRISLRDALHSTLMWDDSAAATTLAVACGSTLNRTAPAESFQQEMNKLATAIGMTQTTFKGVNGAVRSTACARDIALLGMYAIQKPLVQTICSKTTYTATVYAPTGTRNVVIQNTNQMLGNHGVDGVRSAASASAGFCTVASAKRSSYKTLNTAKDKPATYAQRLLLVMLGMPSATTRDTAAARLLSEGWSEWEGWYNSLTPQTKSPENMFIRLPK